MQQIKVNIPTSWDDITLADYLAFYQDIKDATEEHIQNKAIEHFCKVPAPDIRSLHHSDREALCRELETMLLSTPRHRLTFTHNGTEYGFHPDLAHLTFGEWVDLESTELSIDALPKQMAILYRPIVQRMGDRYKIATYSPERLHDMSHIPAGIALGAQVFFWNLGSELSSFILRSSSPLRGAKKKQTSDESGDGLRRLTTSLVETLHATTASPLFLPLNVLSSLLLTPTEPPSKTNA